MIQFTTKAGLVVTVDDCDAWVTQHTWHHRDGKNRYLRRCQPNGSRNGFRSLHREILGIPNGDPRIVDHINGDVLDNRRSNLRVVTKAQNLQNRRGPNRNSTTGVRGVYRYKNWYRAVATVNGRQVRRDRRSLAEAAALAERLRIEMGSMTGAQPPSSLGSGQALFAPARRDEQPSLGFGGAA